MVAIVQQETSADEKVLEVMAPRVTKGHSSDGAESGVQSRAGRLLGLRRVPWGQEEAGGWGSQPAAWDGL